jgi:hypothetical protein
MGCGSGCLPSCGRRNLIMSKDGQGVRERKESNTSKFYKNQRPSLVQMPFENRLIYQRSDSAPAANARYVTATALSAGGAAKSGKRAGGFFRSMFATQRGQPVVAGGPLEALRNDASQVRVIQLNGPLGMILQQYKIKQKIIVRLARAFGVKQKKETRFELLRKKFKKGAKSKTTTLDGNDLEQWDGPPLASNLLVLPKSIRTVGHVALGESHLIALCTTVKQHKVLYGMGTNKWGQLGKDPYEKTFYENLTLLEIEAVAELINPEPLKIDCGFNHTLILYACQKNQGDQSERPKIVRENERPPEKHVVVQLGNILANQQNDFIFQLAPRGKAAAREYQQDKDKHIKTNHNLE